jgi:peptidoglycan hydrolase CwlO-like protein
MHKLLESNDALKEAHTEIERLNKEIAHLKIQNEGLMNERNSAVNMVKKLQKEIDKLKGK